MKMIFKYFQIQKWILKRVNSEKVDEVDCFTKLRFLAAVKVVKILLFWIIYGP